MSASGLLDGRPVADSALLHPPPTLAPADRAGRGEADLDFKLSDGLAAWGPPEARGLSRDGVRLLVSGPEGDALRHARFSELPRFLDPGDVLVVNVSGTIAASLAARRVRDRAADSERMELHLSTPLQDGEPEHWVVELRRLSTRGTEPLLDARTAERIELPAGGSATLTAPYRSSGSQTGSSGVRLWVAELDLPASVLDYAAAFGEPIRYRYVRGRWPLSFYQTVFAADPGSAEMPSAGRPFTRAMVAHLRGKGVHVLPIVLHTGVSSLEAGESPYPERYRVPAPTALAVNCARAGGGRVVAVGTTVVRALETVAVGGKVHDGEGWTDLVVTPERGLGVVDALLTGLHEPGSSHLALLSTVASRTALAQAYATASEGGYVWHEFGDLHLIFGRDPGRKREPRLGWGPRPV